MFTPVEILREEEEEEGGGGGVQEPSQASKMKFFANFCKKAPS